MFFNQYPYLNLNDLNLDFIMKSIRDMKYEVENFVSINAIKYADPIQWDITRQYEKNTIVIDPVTGTAYISVAPVPAGVALTRTEFWTVVFDLGSFVTKAAQNFTSHWESETTLTATFNTLSGGWLVWGDVLYKALTNITAGDTYVVGSNIDHFTMEDLYTAYVATINTIISNIGDLANLTTTDKTSIVNAINEVRQYALDLITNYNDAYFNDLDVAGDFKYKTPVTGINGTDNIELLDQNGDPYYVPAVRDASYLGNKFRVVHHRYHINGATGDDSNSGYDSANPWKTMMPFLELLDKGYTDVRCYIDSAGTYDLPCPTWNNCCVHITGQVAGVVVNITNLPGVGIVGCSFYNSHINFNNFKLTGLPIHMDEGNMTMANIDASELEYINLNGGIISSSNCKFHNLRITGFFRMESPTFVFDDTNDGVYFLASHGRITGNVTMEALASTNDNGYPIHANNSTLFWQSSSDTLVGTVTNGVLFNATITSGTRARINRLMNNYGTSTTANGSLTLIDENMLPQGLYYSGQSYTIPNDYYVGGYMRLQSGTGQIYFSLPVPAQSGLSLSVSAMTQFVVTYVNPDGSGVSHINSTTVLNDFTFSIYNNVDGIMIRAIPTTPISLSETTTCSVRVHGLTLSAS